MLYVNYINKNKVFDKFKFRDILKKKHWSILSLSSEQGKTETITDWKRPRKQRSVMWAYLWILE